ncbi:HNH endonuclease [Fontibacillus panacisegetis]|uniref:HNH endonuclease n=1 Tax=Fontibacillus panacisegetis TaxID=670482 RepID=A0A1G7SUN3_9BACL|nr:HNH endonuclease signature motif containing protein [Fontibacillus panacisegetis]SDG26826.1 HNH endonuclease [Fontibacillus panacisegetis]
MATNLLTVQDYRNTSFNDNDFLLGEKKIKFMEDFKLDHPQVKNIYNTIKNRDNKFNAQFRSIYYEKCAYCGVNTQVIDSSRFEVDHVVPASVLKLGLGYSDEFINGIDNLVNSCHMCNRGKSNFLCEEESLNLLHPDNNNLPQIFWRSDDYSIEINEVYIDNLVIKEFYDKLKLHNQLRRIDYLLMEMKDFCEKHEGEQIIDKIQKLITRIESKRRRNY